MMERLYSFLSELDQRYSQQGQVGKLILVGGAVLLFCCLCFLPLRLLLSGASAEVVPSPIILPTEELRATPTALFNFGERTFTPFPTLPTSTAAPTSTPSQTQIPTATPMLPTETATSPPTATLPPPTEVVAIGIVGVNKAEEYVDLRNMGTVPVNLSGWRLVSETGNQSCTLSGILQPNEILRVWAGTGDQGFSCRYPIRIWNDNRADPAVLYDPQGQEVSRFLNP